MHASHERKFTQGYLFKELAFFQQQSLKLQGSKLAPIYGTTRAVEPLIENTCVSLIDEEGTITGAEFEVSKRFFPKFVHGVMQVTQS